MAHRGVILGYDAVPTVANTDFVMHSMTYVLLLIRFASTRLLDLVKSIESA